jgi:uncharacterized protein YuzE
MPTLTRRERQMTRHLNMQRVFAATGDVPTIVTTKDQGVYVHLAEGAVAHREKVAPLIRVDLNLEGQVVGLYFEQANMIAGLIPQNGGD